MFFNLFLKIKIAKLYLIQKVCRIKIGKFGNRHEASQSFIKMTPKTAEEVQSKVPGRVSKAPTVDSVAIKLKIRKITSQISSA